MKFNNNNKKVTTTCLQHLLSLFRSLIIGSPPLEVILIFLAVHALVDGLTQQAVPLLAKRTVELVHFILVVAEGLAVGRAAVEAVGCRTLCLHQTFAMEGFQLFFCDHLKKQSYYICKMKEKMAIVCNNLHEVMTSLILSKFFSNMYSGMEDKEFSFIKKITKNHLYNSHVVIYSQQCRYISMDDIN